MAKVYEGTDVGLVRQTNEDCGAVLDQMTYIVADGMGGHVAGEVASHTLVSTVRQSLLDYEDTMEAEALKEAICQGNLAILEEVRRFPEYKGMGTTATIFHCESGRGMWAHIGDSRLYLFRQGELRRVTRDHSYVEELVEKGTITESEAKHHPRKNVLTRAVGVEKNIKVDTGAFDVLQGDKVLLCTDGLTNMVSDEEIREVLQAEVDNPVALLIRKALAAGGTDNITAIVAVYDE